MFKKTILFIIAIFASLFLPFLFNPVLDLIDWFAQSKLAEKGREVFHYLAIDKSTYLTILSIEATILVALAIYWMQRRAEKIKAHEQKEQARNALFSTLVASLKEVHVLSRLDLYEEQDYRFIRISDKHFEAISEIKGLTDEDIRLLTTILKELEWLVENEKEREVGEIRLNVEKLISTVMIPPYVQYIKNVAEPKDAFEVMNEQLLSILRKFDYALDSEDKSQYFSEAGDNIIEYAEDGKAIVYDKTDGKTCYAFVDYKGIREGWAKLYREETILYEGEWRNYKKHGQGIEYLDDFGNYQYVSKEGIWNNGDLWDGKIHDVLVYRDGALLDNKIIQIYERFYVNEAEQIKDFEIFGVANLIVKEGELIIDSTEAIREVKLAYENKYGAVKWPDHDSLFEVDEVPNIDVEINETKELELEFKADIEIDRLPIPEKAEIDELSPDLLKYVTREDFEAYNSKLPATIEKVKAYNNELEIYEYAKAFGVEIDLSVINDGSRKANDIYIDISFLDELIVLEGTKENLEVPKMPNLPRNPLDKAMSKMLGTDRILAAMGPVGLFQHDYPLINNKGLLAALSPSSRNYWSDLDGNTISVYCTELLHTRQREFNSKYLLVPTKAGVFDAKVSVICEEYNKEDLFNIQVLVRDK